MGTDFLPLLRTDDVEVFSGLKRIIFGPAKSTTAFSECLVQVFVIFGEVGLLVLIYSDGQIQANISRLIEIGLTVLNPVQPEVLGHAWLKRTVMTVWLLTMAFPPNHTV